MNETSRISRQVPVLPTKIWVFLRDFRRSKMTISRSKREETESWIIKDAAA